MLNFIVAIIVFFISMIFITKIYRKCENTHEKIIFILMYLIFLSPTIVFYLDLYNIPSMFGYDEKIDTQNWLSYIMNYIGTIISAVIGAVFLVYMTMYQINKNNEDNDKRDRENYRIQNMPLLNYEINGYNNEVRKDSNIKTDIGSNTGKIYYLNIKIENIGLASIKDIIIKINSDIIKVPQYLISDKSRNILKKDKSIEIHKNYYLEEKNKYKFILEVYYQDLLNNWYLQNIEINYNTTNIEKITYAVKKEELLDGGAEVRFTNN